MQQYILTRVGIQRRACARVVHLPVFIMLRFHLPGFTMLRFRLPGFTMLHLHLPVFTMLRFHPPGFTMLRLRRIPSYTSAAARGAFVWPMLY